MMAASAGEGAAFSISFSSLTAVDLDDSQQCRLYGSTALSILLRLPMRRNSAISTAITGVDNQQTCRPG